VGFYTLYHDEQGGKYRIQVCNDLPCALKGADEFLQKLCENLGIKLEETTEDGLVTVEAVMCLAGCHHAPLFQVQTGDGLTYHEDMTVESTMAMIDEWRAKEKAAPEQKAEERKGPSDLPDLHAPVMPVADQGTTSLKRAERIRIMQEGGQ